MLNRTDVLKELLEIRRLIYKKELETNSSPSVEDHKIKKDLDKLIEGIIGNFLSREDKEQLDKILLKTICSEISIEIALIAIKEIVASYQNKNNARRNKEVSNKYNYKKYKNSKDRSKHKTFYQEEYR